LIALPEGGRCSAVFTRNAFAAAPVTVARQHLKTGKARYCLINAGNANAGTGRAGLHAAMHTCESLAEICGGDIEEILPFSTGVIGEPFPEEKVAHSLPALYEKLEEDNWLEVACAIMTTDTLPKARSEIIDINGSKITITGVAKGAGMIRPDMATMLAFIGTDARIEQGLLDYMLGQAVAVSFNRICVDGDTSTNDACVLMASGTSGMQEITDSNSESYQLLQEAVSRVCEELARSIVRDGEGASKFITVEIRGGRSSSEALQVGYAIGTSPLVKTAFYASDPNWGRILAAVGRSGIEDLDIDGVSLYLNDVLVVTQGGRSPAYTEEAGVREMQQDEITVRVELGRGNCSEMIWTCDLSHEYVRINAEYRS